MYKRQIQDKTLENFKANQTAVTVFFLNGFQMKGVIEEYDKYVVSFNSQGKQHFCLLYTSPSPRDYAASRMPSSA
ncbi:hypothetical protein JMUB7514_27870 [Staphylococcus aureus]